LMWVVFVVVVVVVLPIHWIVTYILLDGRE
jgi:hypothetical protein